MKDSALFPENVSAFIPVCFRCFSGLFTESFRKKTGKKRKLFPEKRRNLLNFKVRIFFNLNFLPFYLHKKIFILTNAGHQPLEGVCPGFDLIRGEVPLKIYCHVYICKRYLRDSQFLWCFYSINKGRRKKCSSFLFALSQRY